MKHGRPTDPTTGTEMPQTAQPGYYPGYSTMKQERFWDSATRMVVHKRMHEKVPIRFFSEQEARTMAAVVDRILPQEDRLPERRIPLLPEIDKRLYHHRIEGYRFADMPPDEDAYRIAARAFEQMAIEEYGNSFHELGTLEQEGLILEIHDGKPKSAKDHWSKMNVERFWTLLVSDCCGAYYAHPWAWDEIGYGGPAYPRGYMRLEEGEAEPWEVREQKYEWCAPADTLSDNAEAHGTGLQHQSHHGQEGTH